jgi:hypothetical protein
MRSRGENELKESTGMGEERQSGKDLIKEGKIPEGKISLKRGKDAMKNKCL